MATRIQASVAPASVPPWREVCGSSSDSRFRIQGQTGNRQPVAGHWLRRADASTLVHARPMRYCPNMGCRAGACPRAVQIADLIERSARLCRPALRKSLRLSGRSRGLRPPPRRLEGSAFQPARRRFFRTHALRKGEAFPHIRRRSRRPSPTRPRVIWTSQQRGVPLLDAHRTHGEQLEALCKAGPALPRSW